MRVPFPSKFGPLVFVLALAACRGETSLPASSPEVSRPAAPAVAAGEGAAPGRISLDERAVRDPFFPVRGAHTRALPLLVTVIEQTEELLRTVGPSDPRRALLERRLAEDHVELELRAEASGDASLAARARASAIRYDTAVVRDAPDERDLDQVLYERGLEREAAGDDAGAADDYREVLRRFPDGGMAPYAWYGMGVVTRRVTPALVDLAKDDFAHAAASGPAPLAEAARAALAK